MRAIIEVLQSVALWLATGGVGIKPFIIQPTPPRNAAPERGEERRATPRTAA